MWLLYLDESGNPEEHSNFVLAGAAVFEGQIYNISQQLDAIAAKYFPHEEMELHVRELRNRAWSDQDPFTKEGFFLVMDEIAGVIQNSREVGLTLFGTVVHIPTIGPSDNPLLMAYEDICNRFNEFLHQKHKRGDTHKGLVILDYSSQRDNIRQLANHCRAYGDRWGRTLVNLPEAPLFIESNASRMVQLADYCAHALFRRYESRDSRELDKILRRFHREDGIIHGLGHSIPRSEQCMCPSCLSRMSR